MFKIIKSLSAQIIFFIVSIEVHGFAQHNNFDKNSLLDLALKSQIERLYNLNIIEIRKFNHGIENDVFKIKNYNNKSYVLRVSEGNKSRIEQEVILLTKLHNKKTFNNFVPYVVSDSSGKYVNEIGSKVIVLFKYIEGIQKETIKDSELNYIVSNLAKMHKYTSSFKDIFDKRTLESPSEMKSFLQKLLEIELIDEDFFNYLQSLVNSFNSSLKKYKFVSAVHRDLHWKNLIFTQDNQIFLIDFDDFCVSSPILELSVLFRTLCLGDNTIHVERFIKILKNYKFFDLTGEHIDTKALIDMASYDLLRVAKSRFKKMKVNNQGKLREINKDFNYIRLIRDNKNKILYLIDKENE